MDFRATVGWAEDVFSGDHYHLAHGEPELSPISSANRLARW
jgi:hypothetical protein